MRIALLILSIPVLILLAGCQTTDIPPGFYGCADIDGYFTDSAARIVKLPDGQELTTELAEILCG